MSWHGIAANSDRAYKVGGRIKAKHMVKINNQMHLIRGGLYAAVEGMKIGNYR